MEFSEIKAQRYQQVQPPTLLLSIVLPACTYLVFQSDALISCRLQIVLHPLRSTLFSDRMMI